MKFQRILDDRAEVVTTVLINFQMQLILETKDTSRSTTTKQKQVLMD